MTTYGRGFLGIFLPCINWIGATDNETLPSEFGEAYCEYFVGGVEEVSQQQAHLTPTVAGLYGNDGHCCTLAAPSAVKLSSLTPNGTIETIALKDV